MTEPCWLDIHDICAIHGEILAESGGSSGILDRGSLDSTVIDTPTDKSGDS